MDFATRDFSSSSFDAKILKTRPQLGSVLEAKSASHCNPLDVGVVYIKNVTES